MSDTIAVITGASRGIGRAIAKRLADRWSIVALARSAPDLESLRREIDAAGGRCRPITVDLTDPAAVARALAGVEADVLVNNAGIGIMRPLIELSLEEWRAMVELNLNALFYVTRQLLPGMIARGRGHVITIGSLAGRSAFAGGTGYTATKHAVVGFSESLMMEVRDAGVRVSLIMPGSVDTGFSRREGEGRGDTSWMLTAEQVAGAVRFAIEQPSTALISRIELRPAQARSRR
jgi:NADP-dependent 3-hydroxy acid dehydrogenase YdfG